MDKPALLISVMGNLSFIGLKFVHYYLMDHGHKSCLLCLPYFSPKNLSALEQIRKFVARANPLFIGIGPMGIEYDSACELSKYLKRHFPEIPIVWGGVHASTNPESCFPFADYVCIGEGEKAALDFADALKEGRGVENTPNLCYRKNGQLVKNPVYPLIDDLDSLPHLEQVIKNSFLQDTRGDIRLIDKKVLRKHARYQGRIYEFITSRGCPFHCTYCCNNFFAKLYASREVRRRSIENIMAELKKALNDDPEIAIVHIQDDCFMGSNKEYIMNFAESYRKNIKKPFILHSIPIYVDRDKLRSLKDSGLSWFNMGLQCGCDRVNKEVYRRNSMKKDFLRAAGLVKELGIAGKYDVILDNPFEKEEETVETAATLIETPKPFLAEFFSLTFYAGTELHERAKREFPGEVEGHYKKNFLRHERSDLNALVTYSAYLPGPLAQKNIQLYGTNRRSAYFRIVFLASGFLLAAFFRPLAFLKMLKLAHENSYPKLFRSIPIYLTEILTKNYW